MFTLLTTLQNRVTQFGSRVGGTLQLFIAICSARGNTDSC